MIKFAIRNDLTGGWIAKNGHPVDDPIAARLYDTLSGLKNSWAWKSPGQSAWRIGIESVSAEKVS